jgi:hypothetical protein
VGFVDALDDIGDGVDDIGPARARAGKLRRVQIGGQNTMGRDVGGALHLIRVHDHVPPRQLFCCPFQLFSTDQNS